jgi:hypothetical protein
MAVERADDDGVDDDRRGGDEVDAGGLLGDDDAARADRAVPPSPRGVAGPLMR